MALESLPKISPANFSPDNDLIQVYSKKGDYVGVINPSYIKSSPSGVAGAIQFSDGSAFASDATNLFWDDANKRLGIGTNAPTYKLEVQGNGLFKTTTSSTPLVVAHSGSIAVQIENNATGNRLRLSTLTTYASIDTPDTYLTINPNGAKTNIGTSTNLNATLGIKGSGSTSATTSLLVQNSAGNERLRVYDDGTIFMGSTNPGIYTTFGYSGRIGNDAFESPSAIVRYTSGQLTFYGRNNNANAFSFEHNNAQQSTASGISMINIGGGYATQLNAQFSSLQITPSYDLDSNTTTNSIARGIYYNPTITNLRTAKHYGIQTTSGGAYINTTTPQASACLQADSVTQGFLPPRMTDAQIRAIVSPANGLVAYNTDINHLCCYQNGAWAKFSHSPM